MGKPKLTRPWLVGLTGGIGSGKTTVCELFSRLGVPVIDTDAIARDLVARDKPVLHAIVEAFGPDVVDAEGHLRRDHLRSLVFKDPTLRLRLESILHPPIYDELDNELRLLKAPYCVACIPLLLETGATKRVDRILVVDAPEALQIERVKTRDGTDQEDIQLIMNAQVPREARLAVADDVIVNDADLGKLQEQVKTLHHSYLDFLEHEFASPPQVMDN
ncbi:MAG: dephospho-CoA kinase [Gammaproteobacteria bacterium]|nr:dephospho-CoA kinase [Gammaproteobacteria bacterium]MCI0591769.1 dephospho-CoA kinase [Gammaproteobacteria bacterium]